MEFIDDDIIVNITTDESSYTKNRRFQNEKRNEDVINRNHDDQLLLSQPSPSYSHRNRNHRNRRNRRNRNKNRNVWNDTTRLFTATSMTQKDINNRVQYYIIFQCVPNINLVEYTLYDQTETSMIINRALSTTTTTTPTNGINFSICASSDAVLVATFRFEDNTVNVVHGKINKYTIKKKHRTGQY